MSSTVHRIHTTYNGQAEINVEPTSALITPNLLSQPLRNFPIRVSHALGIRKLFFFRVRPHVWISFLLFAT